jgi:type VI secretion system protein ImpB
MKDMGISLKLQVPNQINPDKDDVELKLPITSMKSFSPDEVAPQIPQVKALLLLKTLLQEMQSNIDNRRDLRKLIQEICANPESMQKALTELKGYEALRLPTAKDGNDAPNDSKNDRRGH